MVLEVLPSPMFIELAHGRFPANKSDGLIKAGCGRFPVRALGSQPSQAASQGRPNHLVYLIPRNYRRSEIAEQSEFAESGR